MLKFITLVIHLFTTLSLLLTILFVCLEFHPFGFVSTFGFSFRSVVAVPLFLALVLFEQRFVVAAL